MRDRGGMEKKNITSDLLDEKQVTNLLGITPRALRLWRRTRGLPHLRLTGKVIRYRASDLDRWLSQHSVGVPYSPRG